MSLRLNWMRRGVRRERVLVFCSKGGYTTDMKDGNCNRGWKQKIYYRQGNTALEHGLESLPKQQGFENTHFLLSPFPSLLLKTSHFYIAFFGIEREFLVSGSYTQHHYATDSTFPALYSHEYKRIPSLENPTSYKVSVRSLFIFAIRPDTLRSIVRSPISTTRPPRMSELTWDIGKSVYETECGWDSL
jgi:hypothetical protein